jgi:hypothetical protein
MLLWSTSNHLQNYKASYPRTPQSITRNKLIKTETILPLYLNFIAQAFVIQRSVLSYAYAPNKKAQVFLNWTSKHAHTLLIITSVIWECFLYYTVQCVPTPKQSCTTVKNRIRQRFTTMQYSPNLPIAFKSTSPWLLGHWLWKLHKGSANMVHLWAECCLFSNNTVACSQQCQMQSVFLWLHVAVYVAFHNN